MRRDEQLDDMERTISRLRMDNDAMQEEIKNWRGERDQIRQALDDARTQLAATGCPLCTYINGVVTKSCALHAEVSQLRADIVKVIAADAEEVMALKLQIDVLQKRMEIIGKVASKPITSFPKRMDEMTETEGKIALVTCELAGDLSYIKDLVASPLTEKPVDDYVWHCPACKGLLANPTANECVNGHPIIIKPAGDVVVRFACGECAEWHIGKKIEVECICKCHHAEKRICEHKTVPTFDGLGVRYKCQLCGEYISE